MTTRDKGFDINAALKAMGFGYAFANPFTREFVKDPKHAYRSAWDCFDKMLALDGELSAVDGLYRAAVMAHDTTVEPADETPESERAAEFIRAVIARITNWNDIRYGLLDSRARGLAIAAIGPEGYDTEIDGKLAPKTIEILPQHWFKFNLGEDGRPRLRYAGTGALSKELDESRFIIARHGHTLENPYGHGYLRKAFYPFVVKNFLSTYMHQLFEHGVEPEKWAETPDMETWALKDDILFELENMGRRTASVMPPGVKVNTVETSTAAVNAELTVIRYYADILAKIVLGQTLTTDVGRTGSYELGKIHELQQARYVRAGCREQERDINKQFVEPLCALNFGAGRAKWRILYEQERDIAGMVDNIVRLAEKYNLRLAEDWLYKLLDIPVPTEAEGGAEPVVILEPTAAPAPSSFGLAAKPINWRAPELEQRIVRGSVKAATLTPRRTEAQAQARLLDRQVQKNIKLSKTAVEGRLNFFREMIDRAKSYDDLEARIGAHDKDWPELADVMRRGVVTQYALGLYAQGIKTYGRRRKASTTALATEFADWDEVIRTFGKKIPINPDLFYDLDVELRPKFWTAAMIEDTRITDRVMASMAGVMAEGRTFAEFKATAYEVLRTAGYEFPEPYRLENVFRTNLHIADSAGKEDWYDQADVRDVMQGWEWVTSGSGNVCEECAALEGKQWSKDEPRPHEPLHFQCDCLTIAILEGESFKGGGSAVQWRDFKGVKDGFGRDPREMLREIPQ